MDAHRRKFLGARPSRSLLGCVSRPAQVRRIQIGRYWKGRPTWRAIRLRCASTRQGRPRSTTDRISEHSPRLFASIRGWVLKFSIFQNQLMQVVDFHNFSRYFHLVADISHAFFGHDWRNGVIPPGSHPPPTCGGDGERQSRLTVKCARDDFP